MGRHRVLSRTWSSRRSIVEIAIRALSPAINDTFTGIASVDLLGEALTIWPRRRSVTDAGSMQMESCVFRYGLCSFHVWLNKHSIRFVKQPQTTLQC